ncbi:MULTISPECIES: dihydrofolate reductase family protein [Nocardia]|jgi:dihydrofolate reductase|uniref:Riboflavin biosynthesis protein RibD n=1 Tax=Nocardia nova TaxID=37330 RepID=A0A2S5ZZV7_9NOCA|nr:MULTISPECIES: dihydrofolate reductase family protein [Nocardia]OBF82343.1 riboflavin biosynthesis protein RibD [Mycobacterium sp. 852002-51759_SCH5129042]MBF6277928.1 dihydrofolate reductase family protein [Nocardia nova]MBV7707534.1 dihydrofolate reductase family protein [Nocardia nova]OBA54043.1 riboflavin biosynthesis protein RibD [Nocardia sp. 852002-51101_SCH5132738]OBB35056.1 riboflavin biosynthesis protein RibD [Nocardia sp. 852002-51244_SCH5132740]
MSDTHARRVTANLSITLDGRYRGPGGPADMGPIVRYATTEVARDHLTRMRENATTAVLGRLNAEGFLGFWPSVAADDTADPRDRGYAKWLVDTEKVVLSRTLTDAPWDRTRIVNAPAADVIAELRGTGTGTGDILVNSSASVIKDLLAADLLDRLYLIVCPEIAGGGPRLFDDGLPATTWSLSHQETGELGEMAVVYDRVR